MGQDLTQGIANAYMFKVKEQFSFFQDLIGPGIETAHWNSKLLFGTFRHTFHLLLYVVTAPIETFAEAQYQLSYALVIEGSWMCLQLFRVLLCRLVSVSLLQSSSTTASLYCHPWKLYHTHYHSSMNFHCTAPLSKHKSNDTTHLHPLGGRPYFQNWQLQSRMNDMHIRGIAQHGTIKFDSSLIFMTDQTLKKKNKSPHTHWRIKHEDVFKIQQLPAQCVHAISRPLLKCWVQVVWKTWTLQHLYVNVCV